MSKLLNLEIDCKILVHVNLYMTEVIMIETEQKIAHTLLP